MKLLFVSEMDRYVRNAYTIAKYAQVGRALGHEIAVFGEKRSGFPGVSVSLDVRGFDFTIFVICGAWDVPDMPHLARLLDGTPKDRRVIIDCWGRYNETIRLEHDFNHLEKVDGHQDWEWIEAFQAVSDKILQPTMTPLRRDVRPFLFHAFDPEAVTCPYASSHTAAQAWSSNQGEGKPYGVVYVGNNWQRWTQMRRFLGAIEPMRDKLGPICLVGWDWDKRPDWAIQLGVRGVDVDSALLQRLDVETRKAIPFDAVTGFIERARFSPIFHRPLFNRLGLVTNRTFETFCANTIPILMLPENLVEAIYGLDARMLVPGDDVAGRLENMIRHPEVYWEAILKTRAHLARHHSFHQRFSQLLEILES